MLGVVEGITEFLPVSSTGHLIIVGDLLDFNDDKGKVFEIVIQLGAILAVVWEYHARLLGVATGLFTDEKSQRFVANLAVSFMPAAILGLLFHAQIKALLFNPTTVAIALIAGGLVILWVEQRPQSVRVNDVDDMTWRDALWIGLAQCFALVPGTSRAGATIIGGLLTGLSRKAATEFSFFLAIPIMFAATGFDLLQNLELLNAADIPMFTAGFAMAFVSALLAVKGLLRYIANHTFTTFAWYRLALGVVVLWYFW
ncbi:MAG: undecaprenyl-diphosphate phosphatase [Gammaproteobacteria bacterium]|nr:undecaprenyl-diphosphate phosphatase [Gammaproteobacteria bacterium]